MGEAVNTREQAARLRRLAEELALRHAPPTATDLDTVLPDWAAAMVHELRVHQIELEMQNEELRRAHVKLGDAHARYFDLYHSAPIGLFTLDESGLILEANLYAATRLGVSPAALVRQPFTRFIPRLGQDDFYLHRRKAAETEVPESWGLRMARHDGSEFWAQLGVAADRDADGFLVLRITMGEPLPPNRAGTQEEIPGADAVGADQPGRSRIDLDPPGRPTVAGSSFGLNEAALQIDGHGPGWLGRDPFKRCR